VIQPTHTDSIRIEADGTEIEQEAGEAHGTARTPRESPEAQFLVQDTTPAPASHTVTDLEPTPLTIGETAETRAARVADLVNEAQLAITPADVLKSVVHFTSTDCYHYEAGEL
jgi:hypothetical protein